MDTIIHHNDLRSVNSFNSNLKRGDINPLLRKSYKQLININSRFRNNYTTTPATNYGFTFSTPVKKVVAMKVVEVLLPKIVYTVSSKLGSNNFKLSFDANDISNVITIPDGSYAPEDMVRQMNFSLYQTDFSNIYLKYNKVSGVMTFASKPALLGGTPPPFSLDFTYNNLSCYCTPFSNTGSNLYKDQLSLGWLLGFRQNYTFGTPMATTMSQTMVKINNRRPTLTQVKKNCAQYLEPQGTYCPQLVYAPDISYVYTNDNKYVAESLYDSHGSRYFLLSVNDYHNNHNISVVSPLQQETLGDGNIIAKISSDCCNCGTTAEPIERTYFGPIDISKLHIILYDEFGRVVDLNNGDYSLTLELEVLYDL